MSQTDLERFTEACNYPGRLDETAVERHLTVYLEALGIQRRIERLHSGWLVYDHPPLKRSVDAILDDFAKRSGRSIGAALAARAARDASAALDASDASAALAARAASAAIAALISIQRFAAWAIQLGWWWYDWDISWISCTYFGARQLKKKDGDVSLDLPHTRGSL